jgi:two-component sensor histidine kinase
VPAVLASATLGGAIPALIALVTATFIALLQVYLEQGALQPIIYLHASTFAICGLFIAKAGQSLSQLRTQLKTAVHNSRRHVRLARSTANELRSQTERLTFALEAARLSTFQYDPDTGRLSGDEGFWSGFGLQRADERSLEALKQAVYAEDCDALMACIHPPQIVKGDRIERDVRVRRIDGDIRWINVRCRPELIEDRWAIAGITMDVTERRRTHEIALLAARKDLILRELAHRLQNLFPVINAIVRLSAEFSPNVPAYQQDLSERLRVLESTYQLLGRDMNHAAKIEDLLQLELLPFAQQGRVRCEGPAIAFKEGAAESFAMIVHELATNSLKYGALGRVQARLVVRWSTEGAGNDGRVIFEWTESDGPRPNNEGRSGFGSSIIGVVAPPLVGESAQIEFTNDGLRYRLIIALDDCAPANENDDGAASDLQLLLPQGNAVVR